MQIQDLLNGSNQNLNISCKVCNRVFNGVHPKRTLARHLKSVHEQKTPCHFCSKLIKIKGDFHSNIGRNDHYKGHLQRCPIFLYSSKNMNNFEKDLFFQQSLSMTNSSTDFSNDKYNQFLIDNKLNSQ